MSPVFHSPSRFERMVRMLPLAIWLTWCAAAIAQPTLKDLLGPITDPQPVVETEPSKKSSEPEPTEADLPPDDEFNRGTPRSTVEGFLLAADSGDYARAAQYLDLRKLSSDDRDALGPKLARRLKIVLEGQLWIDPASLSTKPQGRKSNDLRATLERVGKIKTSRGTVDILLERVPREDGVRIWKFSSDTVGRISALYQEFGYGPLDEFLSRPSLERRILKVPLWQWIGLAILAVVATTVSVLASALVVRLIAALMMRLKSDVGERLARFSRGPLGLALFVSIFSAGEVALRLSVAVRTVLHALEKVVLIVMVTWAFFRLLDVIGSVIVERLLWRGQSSAVLLVPAARRGTKMVLVTIAIIASLDNFGFDVTALIAGLGVGGIAVALAAQKSVENLFGGITLYADQPVRVGDVCRFGIVVGTVEDIGLRSTRVRTAERTVITIPNADFANMQLENLSRRDKFLFHPTIGVRRETTPDQLRFMLIELRKVLYAHPKVDADPKTRFIGLGSSSLDIEVAAYVHAGDADEFQEIAEDLNLRILELIAQAGSGLAAPGLAAPGHAELDEERAREAERRVHEWREKNELYLPRFPREKIKELDDTLDYPPKGSAAAKEGDGKRR